MFAPFHSRTQSCPCFIFGLRNKAQRREGGRGSMDSLHYSCLQHMIYAVYIAFIKSSSVARLSTILLLRALIMNVLKITLSIASPSVHPSTFDLFSKTLAEIILRRRRARARASVRIFLVIFTFLFLSHPRRTFRSFPLRLTIDAKRECGLSAFPPLRASVLSLSRSASRGVTKQGWRNFRRVSIRT